MKYIILYILLLLRFDSHSKNIFDSDKDAFKHNQSISVGLIARIKYEKPINNLFSIGLGLKFYTYRTQQGFRFDVFSRYYPFGVLKYLYVQGKAAVGKHDILMVYQNEGGGTLYPLVENTEMYHKWCTGAEIDIGFQLPLPGRKMFIDLNIGYNYYPFPKDIPLEYYSGNYLFTSQEKTEIEGSRFQSTFSVGPTVWNNSLLGAGA